jgi:large subunit ribosomal protein L10
VLKRSEKKETITELSGKFAKVQVAIVAEFNKLDVANVTALRKLCREAKVEYKVVKNTLAKIAAKGTPIEKVADILAGPTALVMGYEDPISAAKVLAGFMKDLKNKDSIKVRGGVVDGARIDAKGVEALAKMPGLQDLRATILRMINTPATQLARVIQTPGAQVARVLQAHVDKQGGAPAAEAPAAS